MYRALLPGFCCTSRRYDNTDVQHHGQSYHAVHHNATMSCAKCTTPRTVTCLSLRASVCSYELISALAKILYLAHTTTFAHNCRRQPYRHAHELYETQGPGLDSAPDQNADHVPDARLASWPSHLFNNACVNHITAYNSPIPPISLQASLTK